MKWNRTWLLAATLLVASLFGGMVTQQAQGQTYDVEVVGLQRTFVEFGLGRTLEQGHDVIILVLLTVMGPRGGGDEIVQVTVFSPDPNVAANSLGIPVAETVPVGTEFARAIQQITFVAGDFSLVVNSPSAGVIHTEAFPVPSYDVAIRISAVTGEIGTQFLLTTTIDIGNMSEVRTHFDIEYVLDGVPLRVSDFVVLFGAVQAVINEDGTFTLLILPTTIDQGSWQAIQGFVLSPGTHSLTVNVVDLSINHLVASETFNIQVTDQIGGIETRLDELALELGDRLDELSGQVDDANSRVVDAEQASAAANSLAGSVVALALVALGLSVVILLIQFGILKLGRFRRGPQEPQEPQEPEE
ncbi:MAG: hypothetical protein V3U17_06400 [Thermoplasmata archaeon]